MEEAPRVAVIGGGSWATAIVKMLSENLSSIGWYMRSESAIKHILRKKHNPNYLSAVEFDTDQLRLSSDINQVVREADYLIFVVPSAFLNSELDKLSEPLEGKIIFSAIKGI